MEIINLVGIFFTALVGPVLVAVIAERLARGTVDNPTAATAMCFIFAAGITLIFV